MSPEQLLAEIEDILKTLPKAESLGEFAQNFEWLGRATAVIGEWNPILMPGFGSAINELHRGVELATSDVFFVDPYLDAEFVGTYLPHISKGVGVRLLAREQIATLKPSVEMYCKQTRATVEVRSAKNFHDRFVFVDRTAGFHSGASFKDGAKRAPTTISEISDAVAALLNTYETIWAGATKIV
jgi:hypothetical protein